MEKVSSAASSEVSFGYGWGLIVDSELSGYIVGRMCTLIESWGLPERQEKAAKDIVRQEISDWFYSRISANVSISGPLNTAIRSVLKEIENVERTRPRKTQDSSSPAIQDGWEFEVVATRKD